MLLDYCTTDRSGIVFKPMSGIKKQKNLKPTIWHLQHFTLKLSNGSGIEGGITRECLASLFVDEHSVEADGPEDGDNGAELSEVVQSVIPEAASQVDGCVHVSLIKRIFLLNLKERRVDRTLLDLIRYFTSGRSGQGCTPDSQDPHRIYTVHTVIHLQLNQPKFKLTT